jgi:hypothetical protein
VYNCKIFNQICLRAFLLLGCGILSFCIHLFEFSLLTLYLILPSMYGLKSLSLKYSISVAQFSLSRYFRIIGQSISFYDSAMAASAFKNVKKRVSS